MIWQKSETIFTYTSRLFNMHFGQCTYMYSEVSALGAWLYERLRRWSNKPDVAGSIAVTTDFFLISCDSNQVPKWFGTHFNLEVPL